MVILLPMLQPPTYFSHFLGVFASLLNPAHGADAPKKRDITLDDLAKLQRVGGPVVSPDGEWVVYSVSQVDTKEDKGQTHLWMVKWDGSVDLQLTYGKEGASDRRSSVPMGATSVSCRHGPGRRRAIRCG